LTSGQKTGALTFYCEKKRAGGEAALWKWVRMVKWFIIWLY